MSTNNKKDIKMKYTPNQKISIGRSVRDGNSKNVSITLSELVDFIRVGREQTICVGETLNQTKTDDYTFKLCCDLDVAGGRKDVSDDEYVENIRAFVEQNKQKYQAIYLNTFHKILENGESEKKKQIKKFVIEKKKANMYFVLPAGICEVGHNDDTLKNYSGIVQIDIDAKHQDIKPRLHDIIKIVSDLPFVSLCCVSPSGFGVKALAHTNAKHKHQHLQAAQAVNKLLHVALAEHVSYFKNLGLNIIDECGGAISQPLFLPYDPSAYADLEGVEELHVDFVDFEDDDVVEKYQKVKLKKVNSFKTIDYKMSLAEDEQYARITKFFNRTKHADNIKSGSGYTLASVAVAMFANSNAFNLLVTQKWLADNNFPADDVDRARKIYDSYTQNFGSAVQSEILVPAAEETNTYHLSAGMYFNQLDLNKYEQQNVHFVAPTGSGKTHKLWAGKNVYVFPTTSLCSQFAAEHVGCAVFFGGQKTHIAACDATIIVSTYDSINKVVDYLSDDISNWGIVLDEVHHFVKSANKGYKYAALRKTLDCLHLFRCFKTLTATPIPNQISEFSAAETVIITKTDDFVKNYIKVVLDENQKTKEALLSLLLERQNPSVVFYNTTNEDDIASMRNLLRETGKEVVFLNSKTKETDEFENIIFNQQIDTSKIYVITSVLGEGVSITTEFDTVDIYFYNTSSLHPLEIEQISRRFRKVKTINAISIRSAVSYVDSAFYLSEIYSLAQKERETTSKICDDVIAKYSEVIKFSDFQKIQELKNLPIVDFVVDELLLENAVWNYTVNMFAQSPSAFAVALQQHYGWVIDSSYEVAEKSDDITAAVAAAAEKTDDATITRYKKYAASKVLATNCVLVDYKFDNALEQSKIVEKFVTQLKKVNKYQKFNDVEKFVKFVEDENLFTDRTLSEYVSYYEIESIENEELKARYEALREKLAEKVWTTAELVSVLTAELVVSKHQKKVFNSPHAATRFVKGLFYKNWSSTRTQHRVGGKQVEVVSWSFVR